MIETKELTGHSWSILYKYDSTKTDSEINYDLMKEKGYPDNILQGIDRKYGKTIPNAGYSFYEALDEVINRFFKENRGIELFDIKYNTTEEGGSSALLIYEVEN